MSMILHCDKCGQPINTDDPLGERSWVSAAVGLDESAREFGTRKDYHRDCARTVTLPEVWATKGKVPL